MRLRKEEDVRVDVSRLLEELCVRLGYCLPPGAQEAIVANPPSSVDAFTDVVIRAEGLDPVLMDTRGRQQVREVVARAFGEPSRPTRRSRRRR